MGSRNIVELVIIDQKVRQPAKNMAKKFSKVVSIEPSTAAKAKVYFLKDHFQNNKMSTFKFYQVCVENQMFPCKMLLAKAKQFQ